MLFSKTLEQTSILLIFILTGYLLSKIGVITQGGKKVLASLLVNLFSPCYYMSSLSSQLSIERINEYLLYLIAGTVIALSLIFIVLPFAKLLGKDNLERNMLNYALAFGNISYFGFPVVGAVFNETIKASMILFCIPQTIAINTYGYQILTSKIATTPEEVANLLNNNKKKNNLISNLRFLYAPPFIGTVLGVVFGLLPFNMPSYFENLLQMSADCQSVTAMLVTGSALSSVRFLDLFTSWKPYVVGAIRLLLIPFIIGLVAYLIGIRGELFTILIASIALPVGMNVVVYPESAGLDGTLGAKMCFISYVLVLITLPVVFELIKILA